MRISDSTRYNNAIRYMNEAKAKLDELSTIATTKKNFQNSSDNPSLVSSALALRSSISASNSYIETSQYAQEWMTETESAFGLMNDLITEANNIMLKGLSDTVDADSRADDYAVQISQILNQAISIANSSYGDKFLFSGTNIKTIPFSLAADGSSVEAACDTTGTMKRDIAPGNSITINTDGVAAFDEFFNALILAQHGLETNNSTEMNNALTAINNSLTTMNEYRTNNSAILKQLETGIEHLETTQNELTALLSIKEDANMAEAITMFNLQQTTYETVIDVCSRSLSTFNLFDVLS
jgi:flagellar hook-associated protein 3 FlgL